MAGASTGRIRRCGAAVRPDDLDRLNGVLAANVRFRIVRPAAGSVVSGVRCPGSPAGVLVARLPDGRERHAASPLAGATSRRARLLQLSCCLAECAMRLELGTAVYRKTPAAGEEPVAGVAP